jgi:hypothetical protein
MSRFRQKTRDVIEVNERLHGPGAASTDDDVSGVLQAAVCVCGLWVVWVVLVGVVCWVGWCGWVGGLLSVSSSRPLFCVCVCVGCGLCCVGVRGWMDGSCGWCDWRGWATTWHTNTHTNTHVHVHEAINQRPMDVPAPKIQSGALVFDRLPHVARVETA